MLEHIKAAEEKFAVNLNPMPHVLATLHVIAARLEAIGQTADGAVAEQVKAIDERLSSLTSAVSMMGGTLQSHSGALDAMQATLDALGQTVNGTVLNCYSTLASRVAALEAEKAAPAVPPVPPVDTTGANAAAQV